MPIGDALLIVLALGPVVLVIGGWFWWTVRNW